MSCVDVDYGLGSEGSTVGRCLWGVEGGDAGLTIPAVGSSAGVKEAAVS